MKPLQDLAGRWPEIDALLDEVLALPPQERARWLAQLDGERAALRDTVAQLLRAHALAETGDFLGVLPLVEPPAAGDEEPQAGQTIGPYRLLQPLGRGGMGTVWLAERADGQLKREVALKLPRLAWGSAVAERLARERDILATLAHPNIARLYDAGVDGLGRPYLALEVVHGQPIDVYCRERELLVRERLALLLQVAAAVAHAHARLVVHRDLKPGNILVTGDGQVRLLDFGIAKLVQGDDQRTQETALTRLAGAALTLDYASPEQIRGDPLSTASDVYSLAVVAYELLAGTRPYRLKRGSAAELEEAIASAEPPRASELALLPAAQKALRGDLDAILNQALKKDPAARYASVAAFAADIERHLRHEPVLARPDGRWYRTRRLLQRQRLAVAFSLALTASLVAGAVTAIWLAVEARAENRRAQAEVARQQAVRNLYLEAMTLLSATATDSPAALVAPHAVSRLLERQLRQMAPQYAERPAEWQALLEAVMLQLNYSSDFARSVMVGQEYLTHLKQHGAEAALVIDAHASLGRSLFQLRRLDESEAMRRAGLAWAAEARDERSELARLRIGTDLGTLLVSRGQRKDAASILQMAETRAAAVVPTHATRFHNLAQQATLHLNFDNPRALLLARQAYEGMVAVGTADADELADSVQVLALALLANGRAADAEVSLREALRLLDTQYPRNNRNRVRAFGRLISALARQGRHEQARALLAQENVAVARLPGADTPAALATLRGRALENEFLHGDIAAALPLVSPEALTLLKTPGVRDSDTYHAIECHVLAAAGRLDEALARSDALLQAWPERDRPTVGWLRLLDLRAWAQLQRGDTAGARTSASAMRELLAQHGGVASLWSDAARDWLALAAARGGDATTAQRELALEAAQAAPFAVARAESLLRRAEAWQALGRADQARAAARAALQDLRSQHPDSPRLRDAARLAGP